MPSSEEEFLVAEADESDRSFLKLTPTIGVVTNIDPEHMENYADFDDLRSAFVEFSNKVPFTELWWLAPRILSSERCSPKSRAPALRTVERMPITPQMKYPR